MERNQDLVKRIKKIMADHPFWGYRRVWASLRDREGMMINKERGAAPHAGVQVGGEEE